MSLVENIINQISTDGLGGITKPTGFDMDDVTFAKLLEKQIDSNNNISTINSLGEMGMPAGLVIEPLNGTEFAQTVQDQLESVGEVKLTNEVLEPEPFVMKDVNLGDYFSNVLKSSDKNSDFMNFAKRQASNAYEIFGKSYITDMTDFVEDITSML